MIVGLMQVTFHIPESGSLKNKRKVVLSLKDRIRRKFNVSLSETEGQNTWQRCTLSTAMVATKQTAIEKDFNRILDLMDAIPDIEITEHWIDYC